MDVLTGLLNGPRASGAFLLKSVLDPPWSLRIQDEAPLTVAIVLTGTAWLVMDGHEPAHLHPGDVAIVRGPGHYTLADDPLRAPTIIVHPGQLTTTIGGDELCQVMDLGLRTWGTSAAGSVTIVTGTYQTPTEISRLLLESLPPMIVIPQAERDSPFLQLLASEMAKDHVGQEVVLDRLLDLVVVAALRKWISRAESESPERLGSRHDSVVQKALNLVQQDPARGWTVATLAAETGVSRAAFARRFSNAVGMPPMAYLTQWRLALAADSLRDPSKTISTVAREVGYGSAFALSTAFTRIRGVSPHHHRMASRAN